MPEFFPAELNNGTDTCCWSLQKQNQSNLTFYEGQGVKPMKMPHQHRRDASRWRDNISGVLGRRSRDSCKLSLNTFCVSLFVCHKSILDGRKLRNILRHNFFFLCTLQRASKWNTTLCVPAMLWSTMLTDVKSSYCGCCNVTVCLFVAFSHSWAFFFFLDRGSLKGSQLNGLLNSIPFFTMHKMYRRHCTNPTDDTHIIVYQPNMQKT